MDRAALRSALLTAEPWLCETDRGPRAVDAGPCDRCRHRPRLLPTCGPDGYPGICVGCARELGEGAWCDGHASEAAEHLAWAAALPEHADLVVTLWWVGTGELRVAPPVMGDAERLPVAVRTALAAR